MMMPELLPGSERKKQRKKISQFGMEVEKKGLASFLVTIKNSSPNKPELPSKVFVIDKFML